MLHTAAKQIIRERRGQFPSTAAALRELAGVGRYTSAAIASIAFNEPIAVVDGNVERVLQRVEGRPLHVELLWRKAEELLSPKRPGDFNQAMMELGAMVCLPRQPLCLVCPIAEFCLTRGALKVHSRKPKQHKRAITYALTRRAGNVLLVRRPKDASLMPGMWELPEIRTPNEAIVWRVFKHSITVTDYSVRVVKSSVSNDSAGKWIKTSQLQTLPLTGLARKILRAAELTK